MALKVLTADATLSTSGGSWGKVEAYNTALTVYNTFMVSGTTAITTAGITQAVTFSNAGNQLGLWLQMRGAAASWTTAVDITIKLQENVASVWTDRTTNTFSSISPTTHGASFQRFFALTSYAVDTSASKWRYLVSCTSNTRFEIYTSTNWMYAAVLDTDTTKPGTGDEVYVPWGKTLTVDEAASWAYLALGGTYLINNPASGFTQTFTSNGCVRQHSESYFSVTTTSASKVTFDISSVASCIFFYTIANGIWSYDLSYNYVLKRPIIMDGGTDAYLSAVVAADANASQKVITTTVDMSAQWQVGDNLVIMGRADTVGTNPPLNPIASISGTSITLTNNIDYKVLKRALLVNQTRKSQLGIWFEGHNSNALMGSTISSSAYYNYITQKGIYFHKVSPVYASSYINVSTAFKNTTSDVGSSSYTSVWDSCIYYNDGTTSSNSFVWFNMDWATMTNIHSLGGTYAGISCQSYAGVSNNITLTKCSMYHLQNNQYVNAIPGSNITFNNVVANARINNSGLFYVMYVANAYSNASTWNDCLYFGSHGLHIKAIDATFNDCTIEGGGSESIQVDTYAANVIFNDCQIGYQYPVVGSNANYNTSGYEVGFTLANTLCQIYMNNCLVGSTGFPPLSTCLPSSFIRSDTHQTTTNNHLSYWKYGYLQSTGSGLSDTTVHTAGGLAIRFEPSSSTSQLTWQFTIPTGSISTKTMTVGVWVKINSANYYAATYQLPRLNINYDNGTTAYAQAAQTTDWQFLYVAFTPTTTYGQITVTVSGYTSQTGSNAYFYVDDFSTQYPANTPLNTQTLDLWASALPVTPPLATVLSANDVWLVATSTLTGSGTVGKLVTKLLSVAKFLALK